MRDRDEAVLAAVSGRRTSRTGWVRGNCPFCELRLDSPDRKQCLGLFVEKGTWHCFTGETRVITRDGVTEIRNLAGRSTSVLSTGATGTARWVDAPFASFGVQPIVSVVLSRNGVKRVVRATPGHRWFVQSGRKREGTRTLTTAELRAGHRLRSVLPPRSGTISVSPWGAAHGFAFGDGEHTDQGVRVYLWGSKDAVMLPFYPLSPKRAAVTDGGVLGTRIDGLPRTFKAYPSLEEAPAYLYGWLAGYFAADGCVDDTGVVRFSSASWDHLEFVRRVCLRLGVFTFEPTTQNRVGLGKEPSDVHSLVLGRSTLTEGFFLVDEHRRRWLAGREATERRGWVVDAVVDLHEREEVFCAEVPDSHAFALEGHILTGNCFRCGDAGLILDVPEDLETSRPTVAGKREEGPRPIDPPPGFIPLYEGDGLDSMFCYPALEYLRGRGLPDELGREARVGAVLEGRYRGRVVVPIFGLDNETWLGWSARAYFAGATRKYLYPEGMMRAELIYNHRALHVATDRPALVVEGVFDALALWPDGVAVLGKPSPFQVEAFEVAKRPIVTVLDGDAWREGHALARKLRFHGQRAGSIRLPPGVDPDEVDRADLDRWADESLSA